MSKLLEADIKSLALNELTKKKLINSDSLVINEFTIGNFLRRVDLVITSNNKTIAFEIKSEADTLKRLDGQIAEYLNYFDKVIVIADSKFTPQIIDKLPDNVGFWELSDTKFKVLKKGKLAKKISNEHLLDLMDVTDLTKLTAKLKIKSLKDRESLIGSLSNVPNSRLREGMMACLNRKFRSSTSQFIQSTSGRKINKEDVSYLSRFAHVRRAEQNALKDKEFFWDNFESYLSKLSTFSEKYTQGFSQPNLHPCQPHLLKNRSEVEYEDVC